MMTFCFSANFAYFDANFANFAANFAYFASNFASAQAIKKCHTIEGA
jgi:hypothetical protein